MSKWQHLFVDGEFTPRSRLLSGLTFEQAILRPHGLPHSIYDELWHTTRWQSIVVHRDEAAADISNVEEPQFPSETPDSANVWTELVSEFLEGAKKATEWGQMPEALVKEVSPGVTLADDLESLAVHNAYHLGKIVALRQMIGAWPPPQD